MLGVNKDLVFVEVGCDGATDDVFHRLAVDGCEGDGTVVGWRAPIPLLKGWLDCCMAPSSRDPTSAEGQPEEIGKVRG